MDRIVVWDPAGEVYRGALYSPEQAAVLERRGACLLPVEPQLRTLNGVCGFACSDWGGGWTLPAGGAQRIGGGLVLWAKCDLPALHWAARLIPTQELEREKDGRLKLPLAGRVSVCADSGQVGALAADIFQSERTRVDLNELGQPDAHGGWTIGGSCQIRQVMDGYAGVCLWGAGRGIKLLWSAVTQTRNP